MKRILQQGKWVDETFQEWPHSYDISTPKLTNKFACAAFQHILNRFHEGDDTIPVIVNYSLEEHKQKWTWRGGDDPNTTDQAKVRAWAHFEGEKRAKQIERKEFNDALLAYANDNGEELLKYLDGYDSVEICFQVITLDKEFVATEEEEGDDDWEEIDVDEDQEGK